MKFSYTVSKNIYRVPAGFSRSLKLSGLGLAVLLFVAYLPSHSLFAKQPLALCSPNAVLSFKDSVVVGGDSGLCKFDSGYKFQFREKTPTIVTALAYTSNGRYIISGGTKGEICVHDQKTLRTLKCVRGFYGRVKMLRVVPGIDPRTRRPHNLFYSVSDNPLNKKYASVAQSWVLPIAERGFTYYGHQATIVVAELVNIQGSQRMFTLDKNANARLSSWPRGIHQETLPVTTAQNKISRCVRSTVPEQNKIICLARVSHNHWSWLSWEVDANGIHSFKEKRLPRLANTGATNTSWLGLGSDKRLWSIDFATGAARRLKRVSVNPTQIRLIGKQNGLYFYVAPNGKPGRL